MDGTTDITIAVLNSDLPLLGELAKNEIRSRDDQASWVFRNALQAERARASKPDRSRAPRRTQTRTNGVARVEA